MSNLKKLKRVVIKEELVELTGDFKSAILLNQLIYWSERKKDSDKFVEEERERIKKFTEYGNKAEFLNMVLSHGWIYKKADELSEECMVGMSNSTIGRYMKILISNGWVDERRNPAYKWDNTKQYRVNLLNIQRDLNKLGYSLEGYSLEVPIINNFQNENTDCHGENTELQNEKIESQNENIDVQNENIEVQNEKTIPETTTKTTTKITTESTEEETPSAPVLSDPIKNSINTWDRIKEILKTKLTNVAYNTWIDQSIIKSNIENNNFTIYACNDFTKDVIEQRYLEVIQAALVDLNINYKINIITAAE